MIRARRPHLVLSILVSLATSAGWGFQKPLVSEKSVNPLSMLSQSFVEVTAAVDILEFVQSHVETRSKEQIKNEVGAYNRKKHFGTWVNQDPNSDCLNTRATVLEIHNDNNMASIEYRPGNCSVATGYWHDPYTANDYTDAQDIQIDHFVPLSNAYYAGAYEWDQVRRCHYANYIGNNYQLLPVFGEENGHKSDSGPDGYMPPNTEFTCQYLRIWMTVKTIWEMTSTPSELAAIEHFAQQAGCSEENHLINEDELNQQRELSYQYIQACVNGEEN